MAIFSIRDPEAGLHTNMTQNDRSTAIVTGAKVEYELGQALCRLFTTPSKTLIAKMFNGFGQLATFSAKIEFGTAMGMYGSITTNDLNVIKLVRNEFAHDPSAISFETNTIEEMCNKLRFPTKIKEETHHDILKAKGQYLASCEFIRGHLMAEAFRFIRAPSKPHFLV
jgi:hypothetical protein